MLLPEPVPELLAGLGAADAGLAASVQSMVTFKCLLPGLVDTRARMPSASTAATVLPAVTLLPGAPADDSRVAEAERPAQRPKTTQPHSELPPRRLRPCTPPTVWQRGVGKKMCVCVCVCVCVYVCVCVCSC